jgi:hypothetical protein
MSERWETITDESSNRLDRIRVPGGWLYRTIVFGAGPVGSILSVALAFVPSPPRGGGAS